MNKDTALERAILRDMRKALAGENNEINLYGTKDTVSLRNLARHVPSPYRGDIEALKEIALSFWGHPTSNTGWYWQGIQARDNGGTWRTISVGLSFHGLSSLVRFVRYLDSLEKSPIVKCAKCKRWVVRHEARYLETPWTSGYYCRGCLIADSVLDSFVQDWGWRFPLPAKGSGAL